MSGDVTAAIEGMKAYFARSEPKPWPRLDHVRTLLAEVERLRAEREALHSDIRQAIDDALQSASCDQYDVRDAVLSVLTADPEADQ